MISARLFVAAVFLGLAGSFIIPTYMLYAEFGPDHWFGLAATYSHAFLFFSTIGLVALIAFYTPATVFVDFYWRHLPFGKLRFILGFVALFIASIYIAGILSKTNIFTRYVMQQPVELGEDYVPALWELHPDTYKADQGEPAGCAYNDELCARQPITRSLSILRKVSQSRTGLTAFTRNCSSDPLLEPPSDSKLVRYCFPLLRKTDGPTCCTGQKNYSLAMSTMFRQEAEHSLTRTMHVRTLPFKIFFMVIIINMGFLLALWRRQLDHHYSASTMTSLENGVLIGATTMLFWPATNQAFMQSVASLYGPFSNSTYQNDFGTTFSLAFGLWALLILFFFVRHFEKDMELWIKGAGAFTSVLAVVNYNSIIDLTVRFIGSGAYIQTFFILTGIGLLVYFSSFFWPNRERGPKADKPPDKPDSPEFPYRP